MKAVRLEEVTSPPPKKIQKHLEMEVVYFTCWTDLSLDFSIGFSIAWSSLIQYLKRNQFLPLALVGRKLAPSKRLAVLVGRLHTKLTVVVALTRW